MSVSDYYLTGADLRELSGSAQDRVLTWTLERYVYEFGESVFPEDFHFSTVRYLRRHGRFCGLITIHPTDIQLTSDGWGLVNRAFLKAKSGVSLDLSSLSMKDGNQQIQFEWDLPKVPRVWTRSQFEFICAAASLRIRHFRIALRADGVEFAAVDPSTYGPLLREFPIPMTRWIVKGKFRKICRWEDIDRLGWIARRDQ